MFSAIIIQSLTGTKIIDLWQYVCQFQNSILKLAQK